MSQDTERDNAQGPTIEERVMAAEAPQEAPQKEAEQAPAPTPSAPEEPQGEPHSNQLNEEQSDDVTEEEALANSKNPERTAKFIQKLKDQLAETRAQTTPQQSESLFDSPAAQSPELQQVINPNLYDGLNQNQVEQIATQFVDQEGNVDIDGLNRALQHNNQQALIAQQRAAAAEARISRYEESVQTKEVLDHYPQLNPQDKKFDKNFYSLVYDHLMVEKFGRGREVTYKQAADHIAQLYRGPDVNLDKVKDQAVQEFKESQAKRNQGPVEAGRGQSREAVNYDDLRAQSRLSGSASDKAIAARLAAIEGSD